ncbi:MAG: RecQ family ATP-dependent DNA helicase, partial [Actinomycetota bacterium]|nr:RecQ family ATP-dependent DNA helicase [Actinomycetota bacterium]
MDARASLAVIFGFTNFRAGQQDAVAAALGDRDALVVMPTGAGKSLCYQLPALMREDLTLVVSPLVSLMHDQAQALARVAPGQVGLVNAQRQGPANAETVAAAVRGELRVLYVSPERFAVPRFVEAIRQARIGLFVVDEAHCVSQWGHDFRPDYFALADAARRVGAHTTMALTATATPEVAGDVVRRLELRDPVRVTTGFDRPNLQPGVIGCGSEAPARIAAALSPAGSLPAIVYAGTRSATETLARGLGTALGEEVIAYHAGLARGDRVTAQERFMHGEVPVIVATNAFGMGIDKADVRTVCHASVPSSLEAYYQEAGRGGRDGLPARCLLFAQARDKARHVFFIQRSRLEDEAFTRVAELLRSRMTRVPGDQLRLDGEVSSGSDPMDGRYDLELAELAAAAGASEGEEAARAIIGHLGRAGTIKPEPSPPDRAAGRMTGPPNALEMALCRAGARDVERARWAQYRAMWEYAQGTGCRRQAMLSHFGDCAAASSPGGCCDICQPLTQSWAQAGAFGSGLAGASTSGSARMSTSGSARASASGASSPAELDRAIVEVVS